MNVRPIAGAILVLAMLAVPAAHAEAGGPAPIMVQRLDGSAASLDALTRGRPTLLVFWASWCGYCTREVPAVKDVHSRFAGRGLNVLAINPGVRDTPASVRRYVDRHGIDYPVLFDPDHATLERFGVHGTPTVILLDGRGREVARGNGVDERAIAELLRS